MQVYEIDPLTDARWAELVAHHPRASVFHSVGWLTALKKTYGYNPTVFTTSSPGVALKNGMAFCHIDTWLTGSRIVSLPFSDHCDPLFESVEELSGLLDFLKPELTRRKWKYIEARPKQWDLSGISNNVKFLPGVRYFLHVLDLRPDLSVILRSLDDNNVRRRIRHANRQDLIEKCGRSEVLLRDFFRMFVVTRKRHRVPPIPYAWFQKLVECLGEAVDFRLAYKDGNPVAGVIMLRSKDVLYFKYGCSDATFNRLGATPWLLWRAIENAKSTGATQFDLGRTQTDNAGLLTFKNHWVRNPQILTYWHYPYVAALDSLDNWKLKYANRFFSRMPNWLLTIAGKMMYRHIG